MAERHHHRPGDRNRGAVTDWNRLNRLELDLAQGRAQRDADLLTIGDLLTKCARLTIERDTARSVAVRLEQENHELAKDTVLVPLRGEAR